MQEISRSRSASEWLLRLAATAAASPPASRLKSMPRKSAGELRSSTVEPPRASTSGQSEAAWNGSRENFAYPDDHKHVLAYSCSGDYPQGLQL